MTPHDALELYAGVMAGGWLGGALVMAAWLVWQAWKGAR